MEDIPPKTTIAKEDEIREFRPYNSATESQYKNKLVFIPNALAKSIKTECCTYPGWGSGTLNRRHSNWSGCHSNVSRVNLPKSFMSAARERSSLSACNEYEN